MGGWIGWLEEVLNGLYPAEGIGLQAHADQVANGIGGREGFVGLSLVEGYRPGHVIAKVGGNDVAV